MSLVELIEHGAIAVGIYFGAPELAKKAFPDPIPTGNPAMAQVEAVMDRYEAEIATLEAAITPRSERRTIYQHTAPYHPSEVTQKLQGGAKAIDTVSLRPGTRAPRATLRPGTKPF